MDDLQTFSKRFSLMGRNLRRTVREFLPRERGRLERLAKATVQAKVYDVYSPTSYVRTFDFKDSIRAYLPDESNPLVLFIDSDPSVAPAKLNYIRDGYAQFIAGEGPGIGFLARTVPDAFPRAFHDAIYQNVTADIFHRFETKIDKVLAKL